MTRKLFAGWLGCAVLGAGVALGNGNVYVSRFWHNHQPIYWPEWNGNGGETERVQYAWDSIVLKPGQTYGTGAGHPDNNLTDIFGNADRVAAYQGRPRDSLSSINSAGGFAISYSGSLIDNVRNLGGNNQLGYGGGWWDGNRQASGWTTPSGSRRLDLVGFTYHHSLGAVLPKEVLRKELQVFKQAWWKAWNKNSNLSDHSKGFFPTEMAFTSEMVDVLVDEGYQWTIVASHHLSRTCPTYFNYANPTGTFQIKSSPPNRADLLGPSPTSGWWFNEPNPGQAAWNVAPHAYQLHRAKYVNPATGAEKTMLMVPSDDALSYVAGYSGAQIGMISGNMSPYATDPARPVIALPSTDGDNAWGGGFDSWMVSTPGFFGACQSAGYKITTIQDFVNAHGAAAPVAHIEDGAWIFPESDYGSPYFLKWVEPPVRAAGTTNTYPGTLVDLETPGFALKFWSWAPVMAGANWCQTAEQLMLAEGGSVQAWKIQSAYDWNGSYSSPNVVERAWHIYLAGLDSGFNYYGGLGNDDEVKPSLATRRAVEILQSYVTPRLTNDQTAPSVFRPQRFPYNPGGHTFGWFNSIPAGNTAYLKKMPSDFYIWTHAYDVSGVTNVTLKVRMDNDGVNTMANNQNETYAGGGDVGGWVSLPMTKRVLPNTRSNLNAAANNGQIDYFITSPEIADYYFAKITQSSLPNFRGKLLDYYIEAHDTRGNLQRTDIQHVFVENDGATLPIASDVSFSNDPRTCAPLTVTYNANDGVLSNSIPVVLEISFDAGTNWTAYTMTNSGGKTSVYTIATIPGTPPSAIVWFHNTNGTIIDSRGGQNWSTTIRDCNAPIGPGTADTSPSNPDGCSPVTLRYFPNAGVLQTATQVFAHVGRNGWQNVSPGNPMTKISNRWEYVYNPPAGTLQIDAVFNNGTGTWDNNAGTDWHFSVSNCNPVIVPSGIVITNPVADAITVSNETTSFPLFGTVGTNISGLLTWSNALTGGSDSFLTNTIWYIAGIPLAEGTNLITVSGAAGGGGLNISAQDTATNAAYNPSFDHGDNGGSGLGPWQFGTNPPAGHFRATSGGSPNLNLGAVAWGLWANSNGLSEVIRPLSGPLTTAQTFRVQFENNWIQNGGSVGIALQNAAGGNLFQLIFFGGATNYTIYDSVNGRDSGIVYTDTGLTLDFTPAGTNAYALVVNGGAAITGTLATAADQNIARFRAYNYQAGVGSNFDVFLNNLRISASAPIVYSNDTVAIVRLPPALHDGIPLAWWNRYGLGTNSTAAGNSDADIASNWEEFIADTDPTNSASVATNLIFHTAGTSPLDLIVESPTTNSRLYDVWVSTDLVAGAWWRQNLNVYGSPTGGALRLTVTNDQPGAFYRTGVRIP